MTVLSRRLRIAEQQPRDVAQCARRAGLRMLESDRAVRDDGPVDVKVVHEKTVAHDRMSQMSLCGVGESRERALGLLDASSAVDRDADPRSRADPSDALGQSVGFSQVLGLRGRKEQDPAQQRPAFRRAVQPRRWHPNQDHTAVLGVRGPRHRGVQGGAIQLAQIRRAHEFQLGADRAASGGRPKRCGCWIGRGEQGGIGAESSGFHDEVPRERRVYDISVPDG